MKRILIVSIAAAGLASCATQQQGEHPQVTNADLDQITAILQRDFKSRGQATIDRVRLDPVQRACNLYKDNPPANVAKPLEEAQFKAIPFPAENMMGDWKSGEKIAQGGRGAMWSDKPGVPAGGSCYNCHELSPKTTSFGTIGPSLRNFGKIRGNTPDMQRYVFGKIYNAKATNLCTHMPRLGASGTLTEQQIKDLVALLLDPESPVNQ